MQLHFLILNSALTRSSFQPCSSSVYKGVNQISYCQKQSTLNNFEANKQFIIQTSQVSNVFVGVGQVQNSIISMQVEVPRYSSFSLFGQINDVTILESALNVTVLDETSQAASVCIQCDVQISYSNVTFVSSGQNASGLVIQPVSSISIRNCFFQLRFNINLASGIVLVVNEEMKVFSIVNFNITTHFINYSSNSGLVISTALVNVIVAMSQFQFCSHIDNLIGNSYFGMLDTNAYSIFNCESICDGLFFVYGLCLGNLQFSKMKSNVLTCADNFNFNGDSCICKEGYLLNQSQCINIIGYLSELQNIVANQNRQLSHLTQAISSIQSSNDINIINNITSLNSRFQLIVQQLDNQISQNVSQLQNTIESNTESQKQQILALQSNLEYQIIQNYSSLDSKLVQSVTTLDSRISKNIQSVMQDLTQFTTTLQDYKYSIRSEFVNIKSALDSVNSNFSTLNSKYENSQKQQQIIQNDLKRQIDALEEQLGGIQFVRNRGTKELFLCLGAENCQIYFVRDRNN
ncbi:Hypothetical_protein [Hexamita inflata]|uniref:Hypothetical_protein n=1 Tax=Hexamita inflata TaxID=28002 RepID=A0AA86TX19_9EUKA|nr:Hypothetical protein HINF_LOCUS20205 [Hexamita inflata]